MKVKQISQVLIKLRKEKSLSQEELAKLLDLPLKLIKKLESGDEKEFPGLAYLKIALRKYEKIFGEEIQELKEELKTLEANSHFLKPVAEKEIFSLRVLFVIIAIIIIGYFLWEIKNYLSPPEIVLISPKEAETIVYQRKFLIRGKVSPWAKITLNGEEIFIDKEGNFQKLIYLKNGINELEFEAKNRFGLTKKLKRKIIFFEKIKYEKE